MTVRVTPPWLVALAVGLAALAAPGHAAAAPTTFTVNSTADSLTPDGACDSSPDCTLREAIANANTNSGADTINFSITGTGPHTITVAAGGLPSVTDPVTIDGTSEPDFSTATRNPVVEIDGSAAGTVNTPDGLLITAGSSTVKALAITGFSAGNGIELQSAGGNSILGNYLGTNPAGTAADGNAFGLYVSGGNGNTVGGSAAGDRNVLSGNSAGVRFDSTGNQLRGNYVGLGSDGATAVPNADGVILLAGGNTIGGTSAGQRNVLSGNTQAGVNLSATGTTANTVQGNFIGLAADGATARGNDSGILIQSATGPSQIGGTTAAARNVIASNRDGIYMNFPATGAVIQGNYVGVASDGTTARGNTRNGVLLDGAEGNQIGGTAAGAGNLITNSAERGVGVVSGFDPDRGKRNAILHNSITANGGLGIDLGSTFADTGITQNDAGDGDNGGNRLQNFPVIKAVGVSGGSAKVEGTLNSKANTAFHLDFYMNSACDSSGNGEGASFVGDVEVTTNGSGDATFNPSFPGVALDDEVTATATEVGDNSTSEFSACHEATIPAPTLTDTDPDSPSANNSPFVKGSAPANSTVKLYTNSTCTSAVAAEGTAAAFASPGLPVTVPDESTTTFYATATDTSNRVSDCSTSSISYREHAPLSLRMSTVLGDEIPEGLSHSLGLTFDDREGVGASGSYAVSVDWGDGTSDSTTLKGGEQAYTLSFSHAWRPPGTYTVTVTVRASDGRTGRVSRSIVIRKSRVSVSKYWTSYPNEGLPYDWPGHTNPPFWIVDFDDEDKSTSESDYGATIRWGDGATSPGTVVRLGPGSFRVLGDHTYVHWGTYPVGVDIRKSNGDVTTASTEAKVAEAGFVVWSYTGGTAPLNTSHTYTVTCIRDNNPHGRAADFSARINWGDASVSNGDIGQGSGCPTGATFKVTGTHRYRRRGPVSITTSVKTDGSLSETATWTGLLVR